MCEAEGKRGRQRQTRRQRKRERDRERHRDVEKKGETTHRRDRVRVGEREERTFVNWYTKSMRMMLMKTRLASHVTTARKKLPRRMLPVPTHCPQHENSSKEGKRGEREREREKREDQVRVMSLVRGEGPN